MKNMSYSKYFLKVSDDKTNDNKIFYTFFAIFIYATTIVDIVRIIGDLSFPQLSNFIEPIRNLIYIAIFLYMLYKTFASQIQVDYLLLNIVSIIIILISYLISPGISPLLPEFLLYFYSRSIPAYFFARNADNLEMLLLKLKNFLWIAAVYGLLIPFDNRPADYMAISYNLLILALIALISASKNNKIYFLLHLYFVSLIFIYGARGPLVCLAGCYFVWYFLQSKKKINIKGIVFMITAIALTLAVVINLNNILIMLYNKFPKSRTISLFFSGRIANDSGRATIQNVLLSDLSKHPLDIRGILTDRITVTQAFQIDSDAGYYAHNFFIEILYQFGILLGIFIISMFLFFLIKSFIIIYKKHSSPDNLCYLLLVPAPLIESLFTGSYLVSFFFWLALGFISQTVQANAGELGLRLNSPANCNPLKDDLTDLQ